MSFDTVIMVDWSAGNDRGASPKKDAIWVCRAEGGRADAPVYHRNRQVAEAALLEQLEAERAAGRRVLVGFDLCFAYPTGFATRLIGSEDPLTLWDWFADRVVDAPEGNNRFDLAGDINRLFPGVGPFWFNALSRDIPDLPRKGTARADHGLPEKRATDTAAAGSFSPWQLAGAGAVGGQVIMGFPMLSRLRHHFGPDLHVWPFEAPDTPIVLAETYFSLLPDALAREGEAIRDAAQVRLFSRAFSALRPEDWSDLLAVEATPEGWVLGLGQEDILTTAAATRLRNDCFALPQGVTWTPVDEALSHLRDRLDPVTGIETTAIAAADGRVLAEDIVARRSHPPAPNSAVDGYALSGPVPDGLHHLPLAKGRSAAGQPHDGLLPPGHALRILTGALIPDGADTVVLQEDVTVADDRIGLTGPLKRGANARAAGEDMVAGQPILRAGQRLRPVDLGMLAAAGVGQVRTRARLRVGVLSTGDELVAPGDPAAAGQIYDANRPMLLADIARWGHRPVDLGLVADDRDRLTRVLDDATRHCDAILTSGGASSGDEDHVSALLQGTGDFALWRIAVKPGRPLALGMWGGTPVFGLPGNPVAAQVCALIFCHPALARLAGSAWREPVRYHLPATFSKSKKAGRREYLRARVVAGKVEVFASEGSGRVSGLSWATGLVELPDEAMTVAPGDLVSFLPYDGFGP